MSCSTSKIVNRDVMTRPGRQGDIWNKHVPSGMSMSLHSSSFTSYITDLVSPVPRVSCEHHALAHAARGQCDNSLGLHSFTRASHKHHAPLPRPARLRSLFAATMPSKPIARPQLLFCQEGVRREPPCSASLSACWFRSTPVSSETAANHVVSSLFATAEIIVKSEVPWCVTGNVLHIESETRQNLQRSADLCCHLHTIVTIDPQPLRWWPTSAKTLIWTLSRASQLATPLELEDQPHLPLTVEGWQLRSSVSLALWTSSDTRRSRPYGPRHGRCAR